MIYTIFMLISLIPNQFKMETIIVNGLLNLSANNKEANLSLKYHLNKNNRNSRFSAMIINNGKYQFNKRFQNINMNANINDNLEGEKISNNFKSEIKEESNNIMRLRNNNKDYSFNDGSPINIRKEKEKESSLIDQSINNISKIEMYPKSTGFNIINPDDSSFNKGSNKMLMYNNSNKKNIFTFNKTKTLEIKNIDFNILVYYCFGRCFERKKKKIDTFHKCISLYKEQMDIIIIFQDFLKNRTNLLEKRTLNEEMKIFLKQTNI